MADTIDNRAKQPNQQKSSGFTNIQDIVRANRQNRLGQAVSGGVSNVVGKNQQDLSKAREQFQQGAQQNAMGTAADQAYANQMIQGAGQSGANPAQTDLDKFAQFRAGQYKGPTQLGNQEQLMAQGQDLQGLGSAATNEYGRRGLLQRFVAPEQQYTQGQQRLDNLLLGQTGGQALNQARRSANLYGQELGQAQQSAQAQAQGLTQQAQQFGQNLQKQLGEAQTAQQQDLENRIKTETEQAEAARQALLALWSKPTQPDTSGGGVSTMPVGGFRSGITQDIYDKANPFLERTGLADDMAMGLGNLVSSPEILLGQGIQAPTRDTIATEQDKSRAIALAKLAGVNPSLFTEQSQVGGYDPLSFLNKDMYNQKLGESEAQYNKGQTNLANAAYIKQATDLGSKVRSQLQSDAALQAKYQQDLQNYENQLRSGNYPIGQVPKAPVNPIDSQSRLASHQNTYNEANELLKRGGIYNELNFQQPGDQGQWQSYNAAGMLPNFDNPYNRMLQKQQSILNEGNILTQDYARIPLLERLKDMITG